MIKHIKSRYFFENFCFDYLDSTLNEDLNDENREITFEIFFL